MILKDRASSTLATRTHACAGSQVWLRPRSYKAEIREFESRPAYYKPRALSAAFFRTEGSPSLILGQGPIMLTW